MQKNNRVYGLVGIYGQMSMWNADMNHNPKTTANDIIYGSDKALKYAIKKYWQNEGKKILYIKHRDKEFNLLNLKQVYEKEFGEALPKEKDADKNSRVIRNILKCDDVRNFGATFAVEKINIGITGPVQIGQGLNILENSNIETIEIMSPFVNSTKEDATQTSLGTKIVVDEVMYQYPVAINPSNMNDVAEVTDGYDGYENSDYENLKRALLICANALDTNSKSGCENAYTLLIELKEGSKLYLANLQNYVSIDKTKTLDITKLQEYLNPVLDEILSVEFYYNKEIINLKCIEPWSEKFVIKGMYDDFIKI